MIQIYLQEINDTPLLSVQEERDLAALVASGDPAARDRMVRANLRLVVSVARGYLGRGLCLDDLIEEGNLGLMRAVEGYDRTMETRFSTYASFWIKHSIRRAIMNHSRPIRLPVYMVKLLSKWKQATKALSDRLGRAPSPEEVGKALRLSSKRLGMVLKAVWVNELIPRSDGAEGDETPLADDLADERCPAPDAHLIDRELREQICHRIDRLEDREATVIRMRFGIAPWAPMTLREVGEMLGLTRERVRQLEKVALRRLVAGL